MKNSRKGASLVELLVAGAIMSLLTGVVFQIALSFSKANSFVMTTPPVQDDAVAVVNKIAADIKNARLCKSGSCLVDSAVDSATSNGVSVYSADNGVPIVWTLSGSKLTRSVTGYAKSSWGMDDVQSIQLRYATMSAYNDTAVPNTWSTSITGDARKQIGLVEITATVARGGLTGTYTTVVRLRNSPKR